MKNEKYLEAIKEFTLMDDTFMTAVFDNNIEFTESLLKVILEIDDLSVTKVTAQKVMSNIGSRNVRLDIFAKDSTGKLYNIEVQRKKEGATIKRARLNSSSIDVSMLNAGDKYDDMMDSYVIFITEHDYFGKNLPKYTVERIVMETGEMVNDGSHIIYVNSNHVDDTPLGMLMHDFYCKEPNQMRDKIAEKSVKYYKEDEKGVIDMCDIMERLMQENNAQSYEKGVAQGIEQGKQENKIEMIKSALAEKLPYDMIAKIVKLPVEEVKKLANA